ncbi:MAG: magnesium transporter [Pseudomonadota bacterium]
MQTSDDITPPQTAALCTDARDDEALLKECHPSDIAEVLEASDRTPQQIIEMLLTVGNGKAVEAFQQLPVETQRQCLETGNTRIMLQFVENMEPDDRVDLLKVVDPEIREVMMPLISQAERNDIRRLWDYAEGTAGALMTTEYAHLPVDITAREALERLRLQATNKETIYYVYIIDAERHLLGTVSLRELIVARANTLISAVMNTNLISITHDMPVEEVASVISKYDFIALPVVAGDGRLVGIVTVDDIIDTIEAESTEDFHRISAVLPFEEEYFKRSLPRLFWSRFCWLAILLFTSLLSTTIMEANAAVLGQMVALAFFIPMVTGTCGNAGTQVATMVVRALALGEVSPKDFLMVFRRELLMGLALGCSLGLMAWFRVYLQDRNIILGLIVGSALLGTLLTANLAGALIPLALKRLRLDPALTAGPFIATIIDAVGIGMYFQIALVLLKKFG